MIFKVTKENRNKSGIYKILNTVNGKFYIGSTVNFFKRFGDHRYLLRQNKHDNWIFQSVWNKYGEDKFIFFILETCKKENLAKIKQYYINLLKPYKREIRYNICSTVYSVLGMKHSKNTRKKLQNDNIKKYGMNYRISDPDGKIYEGRGIMKFCREYNLCIPNIILVLKGKYKTSKGWHLPEYKGNLEKGKVRWPVQFNFLNKEGEKFEIKSKKIDKFCNANRIKLKTFLEWYRGKYKHKYYGLIKLGE